MAYHKILDKNNILNYSNLYKTIKNNNLNFTEEQFINTWPQKFINLYNKFKLNKNNRDLRYPHWIMDINITINNLPFSTYTAHSYYSEYLELFDYLCIDEDIQKSIHNAINITYDIIYSNGYQYNIPLLIKLLKNLRQRELFLNPHLKKQVKNYFNEYINNKNIKQRNNIRYDFDLDKSIYYKSIDDITSFMDGYEDQEKILLNIINEAKNDFYN